MAHTRPLLWQLLLGGGRQIGVFFKSYVWKAKIELAAFSHNKKNAVFVVF